MTNERIAELRNRQVILLGGPRLTRVNAELDEALDALESERAEVERLRAAEHERDDARKTIDDLREELYAERVLGRIVADQLSAALARVAKLEGLEGLVVAGSRTSSRGAK